MVDVINPGITASIGQSGGQINPLEMFARYAYTQNALLQAQKFRATQAAGELYNQSIGPDGKPDLQKFTRLLAAHPEVSVVAPDMLNKMASQGLINAQTTRQDLENSQIRMDKVARIAAGALSDPNVQKGTDLVSSVSDMDAAGAFPDADSKKHAISWLTQMAPLEGPELKQRLGQFVRVTTAGADQMSKLNGQWRDNLFYDLNGNPSGGWESSVTGQVRSPLGASAQGLNAGLPASQGFSAEGAGAAQQNPLTQTSPAPAAPTLTLGQPGPMRQAQLEKVAEYRSQVGARASQTANLVNQLNIMQRYVRAVDTGKFAELKTDLGNVLRSAGFSPEIYNAVSNGDLATSQALMKQFMNGAIGSIANIVHTASAGSKLGQQETLMYMAKGAPNIEMTPEGIRKIIASAKEVAHYSQLENEYVRAKLAQPGYDPVNVMNDWPTVYSHLVDKAQ